MRPQARPSTLTLNIEASQHLVFRQSNENCAPQAKLSTLLQTINSVVMMFCSVIK